MPRAGLAESTLELLRAAVADEEAVARFHAKIRVGSGVSVFVVVPRGLWARAQAVLARSMVADVVVIAHRFGWSVTFGADSLAPPLAVSAGELG